MPNTAYLAHISEDGREHPLFEHLQGTAELARVFADAFGASEQAALAAMAHDIGKYSAAFQNRLLHNGPKVDHATAGAMVCIQQNQLYAAMAVAGHHSGLLDGGSQGDREGSFLGRINKAMGGGVESCEAWKQELALPKPALPEQAGGAERMFFTRMLYSCLTDADFLDTEAFMTGNARDGVSADFMLLWSRFQQYIGQKVKQVQQYSQRKLHKEFSN